MKKENVYGQKQSKMMPKSTSRTRRQLSSADGKRKGDRDRNARLDRSRRESEDSQSFNRQNQSYRPSVGRPMRYGKERQVGSVNKNSNTSGM